MKYPYKYIQAFMINSAVIAFWVLLFAVSFFSSISAQTTSFNFVSMGDSQEGADDLLTASSQIATLNPSIVIHNGDFADSDGTTISELTAKTNSLKTAGIFNQTFIVRGNHDDHLSNSASIWNTFFSTSPNIKTLPAGVTNFVAMDSNSTYLTYSFDYGNSRFIGLDSNSNGDLTNATTEYNFLDARLTDAESRGLTHAFLFWHAPDYCVESIHCSCSAKLDGKCTVSQFVTIINKHPIVSATFHGHEHILGWVHVDNTRVPAVTHPYEEFITSPASSDNSYNSYLYPNRVDYYSSGTGIAFVGISVNGSSFTVNLYRKTAATPIWTKTFTKSGVLTVTPGGSTPTEAPTLKPSVVPTNPQPTVPSGIADVSLTLFLHGIGKAGDNVNPQGGGNTDPSNPQRQVKLEVSNSANQLVLTQQGSINYNTTAGNFQGTVALGTLASGLYTIKVTVPQYLIKTIPGIVSLTSNQTTTLDPLALVTGDSNGDNLLSILDYNMILDCYSDLAPAKNCADANKKLMTDLTDDGSINQFDYNLFLRELSVQSGQ